MMITPQEAFEMANQANTAKESRRIPPLVLWYYDGAIKRVSNAGEKEAYFPWKMATNTQAYFKKLGYTVCSSYDGAGTYISWKYSNSKCDQTP